MKVAAIATALTLCATLAAQAADVRTIGTNPQGSLQYNAGVAVAKVLDEKLSQPFRVQPMAGTSTYLPLVSTDELTFGIANVDDVLTSYTGTGNYTRAMPTLRLINVMFPLPLAFMVPADSPVKKIADLKGLRLGSGYAGMTTGKVVQEALLANGGLKPDDVKQVPMINLFAAAEAVPAGRVDAAAIGPGGTAQVQKAHAELASRGGVRFISIDTSPEAVARMQKVIPSRPLRMEPSAANVGVIEPIYVMAYSMFLVGNEKIGDDFAYNVAKTLHASREALAAATPVLLRFDPARMTEKIDVPFHPGAIKFYQEIGQWPPKD